MDDEERSDEYDGVRYDLEQCGPGEDGGVVPDEEGLVENSV